MAVIFALETGSEIFPNHLAYATSVSGWLDMYPHMNEDLAATGSDIVAY